MNSERSYYVYILASRHHGTLYIGVTNDIRTRLEQHRSGRGRSSCKKYKVFRLVHVETFATPQEAIAREKQLKFWKRGLEDQADRGRQSRLERPVGPNLTVGVMGPGFRQDDAVVIASHPSHRRQQLVPAIIRIKFSAALALDRGAAGGGRCVLAER